MGFKGRKILDFSAGAEVSIVIVDGPAEKFTDRLYRHDLPDGRTTRGLIHFYKQGGEWHFVTEDEYEQKKHELPALCFATKCPITSIADRSWLDLAETAADVLEPKAASEGDQVDTSAKAVTHKGVKCLVTDAEITGPRYHTRYTAGTDEHEVKFDLSEAAVKGDNPHGITPQIFYRLARPMAEGKELPAINTSLYYPRGDIDDTQLKIDIEPDLTMAINEHLIKQVEYAWKAQQDKHDKFDASQTKTLLKVMNEKVQNDVNSSDSFMEKSLEDMCDVDSL